MENKSKEPSKTSWAEIGQIMDEEMSSVENILADFDKTSIGRIRQSIGNAVMVFRRDPVLKGAIRFNELTAQRDIVGNLGWERTGGSNITDVDESNIQLYLEQTYGLTYEKAIDRGMRIVANENRYHPIRNYLESLSWDGIPRIGKVLPKYLGADENEYTAEAMQLLLIAAIKRIYEPGCKFEIMVCLVGGQGAGKSTFFRFLACNDEWFSDDLKRIDDEQVYRKMVGHWIIEMSEIRDLQYPKHFYLRMGKRIPPSL